MSDPREQSPSEKAIFLAALELGTPTERAAYLDRACRGDERLRAGVAALLEAHERLGSIHPGAEQTLPDAGGPAERPGAVIGSYRLIEEIGEGGMGLVFVAEQERPVRRRVALKVIKPGLDTRQVIARFEAERQALALMDHPNVARVLDAGATESGRPYFVMELIKGIPVTEYCDQCDLTTRERLELFVQVCVAIQHAHQKGVIHRDVKPSNVLVAMQDGNPVAKVIDFGIAKAVNQRLSERTLQTGFTQLLGTPLYMSPEQAEMSPLELDTRSDIYSLGVLLYELLTGTTPFERRQLGEASVEEIRRMIRDVEPPTPSTRISTLGKRESEVAGRRSSDPRQLAREVRGDLDWIAMRCLEKDRARRYETASALAADVERHLRDEPVEACPPSRVYRLRKFLRRNKGTVLAASIVLVALLAGIAGTTWGMIRAERALEAQAELTEGERLAKNAAEQEKRIAQAVRNFLQHKLLGQADVLQQADDLLAAGETSAGAKYNPTIRELLDRAAAELAPDKIETQFPGQPQVQAEVLHTIGLSYLSLGEYEPAVDHLGRAHDISQRELGPDHPSTLSALGNLSHAYHAMGNTPEAIRLSEIVRDKLVGKLGPDHPDSLTAMDNLGSAYLSAGRSREAIQLLERVRDAGLVQPGPDHPDTLTTLNNLAWAYREAGRLPEAIALFEQVRDAWLKKQGADHPDSLGALNNLAVAYQDSGRLGEAIRLYEQVRDTQIKKLGPEHPHTLKNLCNLALAYRFDWRLPEAIRIFEQVRDIQVKKLGSDHPDTLQTLNSLAAADQALGRLSRAIRLYEQVRDALIARLGPDHPQTLTTLNNLASAFVEAGRLTEAISLFELVREKRHAQLGRDHPATLRVTNNLGDAYRMAGRASEAIPLHEETLQLQSVKLGPDHPETLASVHNLARAYLAAGHLDKAVALLEQTLEETSQRFGPDHREMILRTRRAAEAYIEFKQFDRAEPLLRRCMESYVTDRPEHWVRFWIMSLMGASLLGQEKHAEAEPLLLRGYEGLLEREAEIPGGQKRRLTEALERLVLLHDVSGEMDQAAQWRRKLEARQEEEARIANLELETKPEDE